MNPGLKKRYGDLLGVTRKKRDDDWRAAVVQLQADIRAEQEPGHFCPDNRSECYGCRLHGTLGMALILHDPAYDGHTDETKARGVFLRARAEAAYQKHPTVRRKSWRLNEPGWWYHEQHGDLVLNDGVWEWFPSIDEPAADHFSTLEEAADYLAEQSKANKDED